MAPLLLTTSSLHWMARPHVFGWLFLLAAVLYLERARPPWRAWRLVGRRAIRRALGQYPRQLLPGAPARADLRGRMAPTSARLGCGQRRSPRARPLVPMGGRRGGYRAPGQSLRLGPVFSRFPLSDGFRPAVADRGISELRLSPARARARSRRRCCWGSPVACWPWRAGGLDRFALAVLFTTMALRSARALPLAALVLLPLANGAIAECCRRAGALRPRVRSALDGFLAYGSRLRALDSRFGGLALVPLVLAGWLGSAAHSRHPVGNRFSGGPVSRGRLRRTSRRRPACSHPISSAAT